MKTTKFLVVSARPIGGQFQVFGPFDTATEAIRFETSAEADTGEHFVIAPLLDPVTRTVAA